MNRIVLKATDKVVSFPNAPEVPSLSNAELERLLKVARLREKVAKSAAAERSAVLLAEFEKQMASKYSFDQSEVWAKAHAAVTEVWETAAKLVAEECERLGIPERFAPSLSMPYWHSRGENAVKERRAELRKVAVTRVAAMEKQARTEIERKSSEVQIELLAHGMSLTARELLEQMPRVDELMPTLRVDEIETMLNPRLT
jgi:hypothetical protein